MSPPSQASRLAPWNTIKLRLHSLTSMLPTWNMFKAHEVIRILLPVGHLGLPKTKTGALI